MNYIIYTSRYCFIEITYAANISAPYEHAVSSPTRIKVTTQVYGDIHAKHILKGDFGYIYIGETCIMRHRKLVWMRPYFNIFIIKKIYKIIYQTPRVTLWQDGVVC